MYVWGCIRFKVSARWTGAIIQYMASKRGDEWCLSACNSSWAYTICLRDSRLSCVTRAIGYRYWVHGWYCNRPSTLIAQPHLGTKCYCSLARTVRIRPPQMLFTACSQLKSAGNYMAIARCRSINIRMHRKTGWLHTCSSIHKWWYLETRLLVFLFTSSSSYFRCFIISFLGLSILHSAVLVCTRGSRRLYEGSSVEWSFLFAANATPPPLTFPSIG